LEKEPRKGSEVLLALESKIDTLLGIVQSQDSVIKVLSNKINALTSMLSEKPKIAPQITVEAVNIANPFLAAQTQDPAKQIPVSFESKLPVEESPTGFRRTSRPETYVSGDDAYLRKVPEVKPKFPTQIPEIVVPKQSGAPITNVVLPNPEETAPQFTNIQNAISVSQRIVDKNGKSVFLADVEIVNLTTKESVKTRTNGTGKWFAALAIGDYKVIIRKRESLTKEKVEIIQDLLLDGNTSPLAMQTLIIK
jgi:hypothetical protein